MSYLKTRFENDGFLVFDDLFTDKEIISMRKKVFSHFDINYEDHFFTRTTSFFDRLPSSFNYLKNSKKILELVSKICGEDVKTFRHNDLHIDAGGGTFHRDSAERNFGVGSTWTDPEYKIFRVAIYLSDYKSSGSSLNLIKGSHKRESYFLWLRYKIFNKFWLFLRKNIKFLKLPHMILYPAVKKVKTKPGTTVVFDPRIIHAGGHLFGNDPKLAIYISFAVENHCSAAYLAWLEKQGSY